MKQPEKGHFSTTPTSLVFRSKLESMTGGTPGDPSVIFGELQQTIKGALKFHGTNLCFALLSPTVTVFRGEIDSSSDPTLVGKFYVVEVVDNREGGGSAPDQYGIEFTNRPPDCTHVNVQLHDLIRGNIQVH